MCIGSASAIEMYIPCVCALASKVKHSLIGFEMPNKISPPWQSKDASFKQENQDKKYLKLNGKRAWGFQSVSYAVLDLPLKWQVRTESTFVHCALELQSGFDFAWSKVDTCLYSITHFKLRSVLCLLLILWATMLIWHHFMNAGLRSVCVYFFFFAEVVVNRELA